MALTEVSYFSFRVLILDSFSRLRRLSPDHRDDSKPPLDFLMTLHVFSVPALAYFGRLYPYFFQKILSSC